MLPSASLACLVLLLSGGIISERNEKKEKKGKIGKKKEEREGKSERVV